MPVDRDHARLDRYLLRGERIVVGVHRHWATVAEPVATAVLTFVLAVVVNVANPALGPAGDLLWWVWFAMVGRALFFLYEWRQEWFLATDRRLLLIYGFIVRKVDMMPLTKVTDMTYNRTVLGRIFGYGTFVLESAGQDQALSRVGMIPDPDRNYQRIIAQIFHREGDEDVEAEDTADSLDDVYSGDEQFRRDERFDSARRVKQAKRARAAASGTGTPRRPLLRRLLFGTGRNDEYLNTTLDRGRTKTKRPAPVVTPERDPDTEDLWLKGDLGQSRAETLYSSRDTGPVEDLNRDTTGWWHQR